MCIDTAYSCLGIRQGAAPTMTPFRLAISHGKNKIVLINKIASVISMHAIFVLARYSILHNKDSVSVIFRPDRFITSCYN